MHHSKTARALLCQKLAVREIDIALIWETRFMGTIQGDYAIQGGQCFLLDLVLLLDPAFLSGTQFMPFHCHSSVLGM